MKTLDLNTLSVAEISKNESIVLNGGYAPINNEPITSGPIIDLQPFPDNKWW